MNRRRIMNIHTMNCILAALALYVLTACGAQSSSPAGSDVEIATGARTAMEAPEKIEVSAEELAYYSPEMKAIYERGVLRVAIYAEDRVPFFYLNDTGVLTGSDVELATDMAAQFGVAVEFIRTAQSFDEVVDQVSSGQADIAVSKLSATLSRAKKVLFSEPYLTLHQGLLVNRLKMAQLGQPQTPLLDTIKRAPVDIGVVSGTSYVRFASALFPFAGIKLFPTTQDMADAALRGEIAAMFYDELQLKNTITDNPTHSVELQLIIMNDQIDPISIAVPPDHVQLLNWVNLYLRANQSKISDILIQYGIQTNGGA